MPTPRASWVWVDLSPNTAVANQDKLLAKPVPCDGTIKEIWISINTLLATGGGLVALAKNAVNVLSATNLALTTASFTAATPLSCTLTTQKTSLRVTTSDVLKATYTLTTLATTNAIGCLVAIEPDLC